MARRGRPRPRRPTWWRSAPTSSAGPRASAPWSSARACTVAPLLHGGGQERDRRSGTHNVAGIVAMAAAMRATVAERADDGRPGRRPARPAGRRAAGRGARAAPRPATGRRRSPATATCRSTGVESEALLVLLDGAGVYASAGSACASGAVEPSHVLAAMGVSRARALGSLRLSLGRDDHRRRRRPGPGRHPAGRGPAAGRRRCGSSPPCRAASTRRWPPPCWSRRATTSSASPCGCGAGRRRRRLLLGGRDRRRPPGRPPARHRPPGVGRSPTTSTPGSSRPTSPPTPPGCTPNPCIECNRHLKFDRLLRRAAPARLRRRRHRPPRPRRSRDGGRVRLLRGADPAKDQSYVLYVLGQAELARCLFPVGELTKAEVRAQAAALGLRTADKPDSQDVCFVTTTGGREAFLALPHPPAPGPGRRHRRRRGRPGRRRRAGHRRPAPGPGHRRRRPPLRPLRRPAAGTVVGRRAPADLLADSVALTRPARGCDEPVPPAPVAGPVQRPRRRRSPPRFDGTTVRFAEPAAPGGARPERRPLPGRRGPRRRHRHLTDSSVACRRLWRTTAHGRSGSPAMRRRRASSRTAPGRVGVKRRPVAWIGPPSRRPGFEQGDGRRLVERQLEGRGRGPAG